MLYKKLFFLTITIFIIHTGFSQTVINLHKYYASLKYVEVEIENKTYNFLFDTGGGESLISPKIVKILNKEAYGKNVGFRMSGEKVEYKICDSVEIKMGGRNFFHENIGVFDIMSLLPKDFKRVDGLISLRTFKEDKIILNLSKDKLLVETDKSFDKKIKKMNPVHSRFVNGPNGSELNIFLGSSINDHLRWFLFDTGNITETLISNHLAEEMGFVYGSTSESRRIEQFNVKLAVYSYTIPGYIKEIIYDGALSYDFIKQSVYAVSFKEKKVWAKKISSE